MNRFVSRSAPLVALFALVLICFARLAARPGDLLVDGDRASIDAALQPDARALGNDLTRLFLPNHARVAEQVARGRLPSAWDPWGFGGRPRVGNPQSGLFYPPVWLVWLAWTPSALSWLTAAHLVSGGIGAFVLARQYRVSAPGATVAALVFAGSPYLLAHVFEGHYPHVWSVTWYPWAFLATERLRRGDWRGASWLPPILALGILAGHAQETYYLLLALGAWTLADGLRPLARALPRFGLASPATTERLLRIHQRREWRGNGRAFVNARPHFATKSAVMAGLLLISAGLSAVEWIPDVHAAQWALRGGPVTVFEAGRYHVSALNLLQLLSPRALGGPADYIGHENYWETILSFGWTPLVLILLALTRASARRGVKAWGILLIASIVFAAGWRLGFFAVMHAVAPGMGRFRAPGRALFLAALAAAMLAGFGIDALQSAGEPRRMWSSYRRMVVMVGVLLATGCAIAWARGWSENPYASAPADAPLVVRAEPRRDRELRRWATGCSLVVRDPIFWASLAGTTGVVFWLRRRPGNARGAAVVCVLLVFGELGWNGAQLLKTTAPQAFLGDDPIARAIARESPPTPFRIRARDAFYSDLRAQESGLEKVNINDSFQLQHAADLYETLYELFRPVRPIWARMPMAQAVEWFRGEVRQSVLDRMGVAFLISDRPQPGASWPIVAEGRWRGSSYVVYRNRSALPRAYVVPRAKSTRDDDARVILTGRTSPRDAVLMAFDPLDVGGERQPFTPATYDGADPDCIVIHATTVAPGLLVVTDAWMPGWVAEVDGESTPVLLGDHAHRVAPLRRAGDHRIVMRYRPPGLRLGLAITSIAAAVWLVLSFSWARRRRLLLRASKASAATPLFHERLIAEIAPTCAAVESAHHSEDAAATR
jgi:hypothetical protein